MPVTERNFGLVISGLEKLDATVLQGAATGLQRGLIYMIGVAQRQYLSGPRPKVLDVRTRRLRQSLESMVEMTPQGVTGRAGTNLSYGAFHEFGFHGNIPVKAHTRVVGQSGAKGEALDYRRVFREKLGKMIGFRDSRKQSAAKQRHGIVLVQFVTAHSRHVDYAGRPFLRPALVKCLPVILNNVKAEIKAAVQSQN